MNDLKKTDENQTARYKMIVPNKVLKYLDRLPHRVYLKFQKLHGDLERFGPMPKGWKNLSKLGENEYHCHLMFHWVACWYHYQGSIEIRVYYVGSREKAPY